MPGSRYLLSRAVFLAVLALVLTIAVSRDTSPAIATTFSPTLSVSVSDNTPGAPSDVIYDFNIPAPDANFQDVVNFLPPEFGLAPDADVADGAVIGKLEAEATLGLINAGCNTTLAVEFTLWESTTDTTDFLEGPGTEDVDGDGLMEAVEGYPEFLNRIFPGIEPVRRFYGQTFVAGTINILNFLIFEPGTTIPFVPAFDASLGYPTFAILNDPGAPAYPNPITDFCTPLSTMNTVYGVSKDNTLVSGNQAGAISRFNPDADGAYVATSFVRSLWDADGDGIESNLDPCRYQPDTVWDPRALTPAGDVDRDGLPATCDPNDNQFEPDQDDDGFENRQDHCPLVPDGNFDVDLDDIGDACDVDPLDPSDGGISHRHVVCTTSVIQIGSGGPAQTPPPCPTGPDLPALEVYGPSLAAAGDVITVQGSVRNNSGYGYFGSGLPGVTLDFVVTGANTAQGSCLTSNDGHCEYNYLGTNAGEDTITVAAPVFGVQQTTTVSVQVPAANDDFANAVEIPGVPYDIEVMAEIATSEPGEELACNYESTWYKFVATEEMFLSAELEPQSSAAQLGVFKGDSLTSLDLVRCAFGFAFPGHEAYDGYAYFLAEAGETYYFSLSIEIFSGGGELPEVNFSLTQVQGVVGDLNCDGEVGPPDSLFALKLDAGVFVPECAVAFGDTNCDGEVNALDSLRILMFDAGKPLAAIEACPAVAWSSA
jgi:hypothetical protein